MSDVLAIVPARGGSKGLPNKNLIALGGRPLLHHTVAAALASGVVERVLISTDSPAIAESARAAGAEAPFVRPADLSQDDTPTIPVLLHALAWLEERGQRPSWVMCLQPTSPLRSPDDIRGALALAREREADAVVSVTPAHPHPAWSKAIDSSGRLTDLFASASHDTRRQDLPPAFVLNGAIYLSRSEALVERRSFYGEQTYAWVMPPERSIGHRTRHGDLQVADLALRLQQTTPSRERGRGGASWLTSPDSLPSRAARSASSWSRSTAARAGSR